MPDRDPNEIARPLGDISLYHLDQGLSELLDYRAERVADTIDPPDADELEAVDGQIRKYLEALPTKIDGVAAVLLHRQRRQENLASEIKRLTAALEVAKAEEVRLKDYIAAVLEKQPMPKKGPRKLVGQTSELRLVQNGGLAPLLIDDETMIPNEYRVATVTLPYDIWFAWKTMLPVTKCTVAVSNTAVRKGIEEHGGVPGAHIGDRGQRVEVR